MSQKGFVNPAVLGAVGAVVAGCTLFLYYEGNTIKTSQQPPTQQDSQAEEAPTNFPTFSGSTFVRKDTIQNCKNIDPNHPSVPICESIHYIYSAPADASVIRDWFGKEENTKPWKCSAAVCENENGDQFELIIQGKEIIYKSGSQNYDSYTYLPNWQTVFAKNMMYSYPPGWSVDDSGLKSPDYEASSQNPAKPIITKGCVINGPASNVQDSAKNSQKFPFLADPNAALNSWQDPVSKTFHWELKSRYKTVTLQSATQSAGDSCQDTFWKYAKSIKIIENPGTANQTLLETN